MQMSRDHCSLHGIHSYLFTKHALVVLHSIAHHHKDHHRGRICNIQRPLFTSQHPLATFIYQTCSCSSAHIHSHKEDSTLGAFATSRDHCSLPLATHLFTKHALIQLTSYSSTHIHSSSTRRRLPWVHLQRPETTVHFTASTHNIYSPNVLL